jgi:hypothetical protein
MVEARQGVCWWFLHHPAQERGPALQSTGPETVVDSTLETLVGPLILEDIGGTEGIDPISPYIATATSASPSIRSGNEGSCLANPTGPLSIPPMDASLHYLYTHWSDATALIRSRLTWPTSPTRVSSGRPQYPLLLTHRFHGLAPQPSGSVHIPVSQEVWLSLG